jgi:hypothetical protein
MSVEIELRGIQEKRGWFVNAGHGHAKSGGGPRRFLLVADLSAGCGEQLSCGTAPRG